MTSALSTSPSLTTVELSNKPASWDDLCGELYDKIFGFLDHPADLAHCARIAHRPSKAALDHLWREVELFCALDMLVKPREGEHLYDGDMAHGVTTHIKSPRTWFPSHDFCWPPVRHWENMHLQDQTDTEQWKRFTENAGRVRRLVYAQPWDRPPKFHERLLGELDDICRGSTEALFPCANAIIWLNDTRFIHIFLHKDLRNVMLRSVGCLSAATLASRAPNLTTLEFIMVSDPWTGLESAAQSLEELLRHDGLQKVEEIRLPESFLSVASLTKRLSALRKISFLPCSPSPTRGIRYYYWEQ